MNIHSRLPRRSPPQTLGHSGIQSPLGVIHRSHCSCRVRRCSQSHVSCSLVLRILEDICRSIRSAGPHTESEVPSTGCFDTHSRPLCSYHLLAPPGRCSGTLWCQESWCSFHMEQRSRRHRVHHSFCPCIGPPLWHRCRHNHPWCPHKKLRSGRVQTNTCPMWLSRGFLKKQRKCYVDHYLFHV